MVIVLADGVLKDPGFGCVCERVCARALVRVCMQVCVCTVCGDQTLGMLARCSTRKSLTPPQPSQDFKDIQVTQPKRQATSITFPYQDFGEAPPSLSKDKSHGL